MINWQDALQFIERQGVIEQCIGLKLVASGPPQCVLGEICNIFNPQNQLITCAEVVGFEKNKVFLMPFSKADIGMGYKILATGKKISVNVGPELFGRIINALGRPIDGLALHCKKQTSSISSQINPFDREPITERLDTGIHAIDSLIPLGKGQRIGLFAGSGVGKSFLLGMMAQQIKTDVNVIALIGERGREVNDFIRNNLDQETLAKSVIIVACSDDFALMRKQAVYTACTVAEYFCNQGQDVMLFMDSITRFAMAQREISLSLGEPPTTRGYTPTVFSLLPGIVERAGNFKTKGSITALYTILVEGDDFNEPIADNMRSLLDGHIVLTRELAHKGHYPAIDVLQSISRLSHELNSPEDQQLIKKIFNILSLYQQNKELLELGAYTAGQNQSLDYSIARIEAINNLLKQNRKESMPHDQIIQALREIVL